MITIKGICGSCGRDIKQHERMYNFVITGPDSRFTRGSTAVCGGCAEWLYEQANKWRNSIGRMPDY